MTSPASATGVTGRKRFPIGCVIVSAFLVGMLLVVLAFVLLVIYQARLES